jgi:hypothetical protein
MEIGDKTVPETRLSTLIPSVKALYGKFSSQEIDHETAASLLGHATPRSGAYRQKIADLRSFDLIDSRGSVRVSEIGRKLSYPNNPEEETQGLIEAISNVELWKLLYEKYTAKRIELPSDLWIDLRTWTGLPPETAKNKADFVRKAYYGDIKYLRPQDTSKTQVSQMATPDTSSKFDSSMSKAPETVDELRLGEIRLWLPKSSDPEGVARKAISLISLHTGIQVEFKESKKKSEA